MSYTTHGYHVPGTIKTEPPPISVIRCGGPTWCSTCNREAAQILNAMTVQDDQQLRLRCLHEAALMWSGTNIPTAKDVIFTARKFVDYVKEGVID